MYLQKRFWCGNGSQVAGADDDVVDYGDKAEFFEPNPTNVDAGISIRNLTKVSIDFICIALTSEPNRTGIQIHRIVNYKNMMPLSKVTCHTCVFSRT